MLDENGLAPLTERSEKEECEGHVRVSPVERRTKARFRKGSNNQCTRRRYEADGEGNRFKCKEKQQYTNTAIGEMIEPS